jgi:glycosyltransferase involved in cell wall biosynthesis
VVIPNGVDCAFRPFDTNPHKSDIKNILFCGTLDYSPNTEGVLWFYEKIFPLVKERIPGIEFTVIGKMHVDGPYELLKKDESVHFIGPVDDVTDYYRQSSLMVVPLLKGSGTRLKILEAMSMGNPVVSTSVGAEGLKATPGKHFMLADSEETFANAIVFLLQQPQLFDKMRCEARRLVEEKYDWKTIGKEVQRSFALLSNMSYN